MTRVIIVIFTMLIHNCLIAQLDGFGWLYNVSKKTLIADDHFVMDTSLFECVCDELDYNRYLQNEMSILNALNPTFQMIETGASPSFIFKVKIHYTGNMQSEITEVQLVSDSTLIETEWIARLKKKLLGSSIYSICQKEDFFIHVPIRFEFRSTNFSDSIEISKSFENGWFVIFVKNYPVISN